MGNLWVMLSNMPSANSTSPPGMYLFILLVGSQGQLSAPHFFNNGPHNMEVIVDTFGKQSMALFISVLNLRNDLFLGRVKVGLLD